MRKTLLIASTLILCSAMVSSPNVTVVDNDTGVKELNSTNADVVKAAQVEVVFSPYNDLYHFALNDATVPVVPEKSTRYLLATSDVASAHAPSVRAAARGPTTASNRHLIPSNRDKPV